MACLAAPSPRRPFGLLTGLFVGIWVVLPFLTAGRLSWEGGWLYGLSSAVGLALQWLYVTRKNPELAARRHAVGAGTKRWDLHWNWVFWILMASAPLVAGLEASELRPERMPWWLAPVGVLLLASGLTLTGLAMAANPFFEGTVRIQRELGHRVFDEGLYRRIRHPGYAGVILWALAAPFLAGSWWALIPAVVTGLWVIFRTVLEDATLQRELDGYAQYAGRVRFRLVPLVW